MAVVLVKTGMNQNSLVREHCRLCVVLLEWELGYLNPT